jgi:ABC-2 type transport system permease protein
MIKSILIGISRTIWLLLRLQMFRLLRQLSGGLSIFRKKDASPKRTATAAKRKQGLLIGALVGLSVAFTFTNISYQSISNIKEAVGSTIVTSRPTPNPVALQKQTAPQRQPATVRVSLPPAAGFTLAPSVLSAVALQSFLFLIAITLLSIGNGELIKQDWDLEWLVTLPVTLSTLMISRIFARVPNPVALYLLLPFLSVIAWESGYRATAPLIALATALPLLMIVAALQTLADTGLRLRLGPPQLRNLQAFVPIVSVIVLFFALSPGMPTKGAVVIGWAAALPDWLYWLPPGLAIQAVASSTALSAAQSLGLLAIEAVILTLLVVTFLRLELRSGIVAAGGRESGRRERVKRTAAGSADRPVRRFLLTPIQVRELRLLGRDRTFLVQTLIMPVVMVGIQVFANGSGTTLFTSSNSHPEYLASIAFGISAYALMFSAFQILNAEGQALWILYTVPQSMESILRQKATLWGVASLFYPITLFSIAVAVQGTPPLQFVEFAGLVFIGVPIFAVIATSLGVFACDPLAQDVQRRIKVSYTYLYLLLSSTYTYSVYANSIWQRLSLLVLTILLAFALYQKAKDHLPYLLDPAKAPPARVSISDGLIAALLFFVLQGVVTLFRVDAAHKLTGFDVLVAFSIAGAATFGIMQLSFWRLKSEGVPRTFGQNMPNRLALGASRSG